MKQKILILTVAVWLAILGNFSVWAQMVSDDELIRVVERFSGASPGLTNADRALIIQENNRINSLAAEGRLGPDPLINQNRYNRAQRYFDRANQISTRNASRQVGLPVQPQPRRAGAINNPGRDTDWIVCSPDGTPSITRNQLSKLEATHQEEMKRLIRKLGGNPPAGWLDTNTDFMPLPEHSTPEVFQEQIREINARGGAAYRDEAAVTVEYQMRQGGTIDLGNVGNYVTEMQYHADRHFRMADDMQNQARVLEKAHPAPSVVEKARIKNLDTQARILRHRAAKYVQRINDLTTEVAFQYNIDIPAGDMTDLDRALQRAAGRRAPLTSDPLPTGDRKISYVEMSTIKTGGLNQQLIRKAVLTNAETLARAASQMALHNPSQALAAQESIARSMGGLPPAQQGEIIQAIERTAGKQMATNVAHRARHYQPKMAPKYELKKVLTEGAAGVIKAITIFNIAADIKEIVTSENPEAVLIEKAEAYLDGFVGGQYRSNPERLAAAYALSEEGMMEHDEYIRGVEAVLYQSLEFKLRRMGVAAAEARRIANDYYRGDTSSFRAKAEELRAAGIQDPHPEMSRLDGGVWTWDQDDTALERLLQIGEGILQAGQRAGTFIVETATDTSEIFTGLFEPGVAKELIWERDPRLLLDIFHTSRQEAADTGRSHEDIITYLEALGASPIGARRAADALLNDGDKSQFRQLVGVLQKRAEQQAREMGTDSLLLVETDPDLAALKIVEDLESEGKLSEQAVATCGVFPVAQIIDAAEARILRDPDRLPRTWPSAEQEIMTASGNWVQAYGGWRTEEVPPNKPKEVGPFDIQPGKYRAELEFAPDIRASMTSYNRNTSMGVSFVGREASKPASQSHLTSIAPGPGNKPRGEAATTFSVNRAGRIYVRFGVAASGGHAGGYAEHEQSYTGRIVYLEPVPYEIATSGESLMPGDTFQAGAQDAFLLLADGTLVAVRARSELRMEATGDGAPRIVLLKGGGRFVRRGGGFESLEVVAPDGRSLIRPQGTDFLVFESGLDVFEGVVIITMEDEPPVTVESGQRFKFSDRMVQAAEDLSDDPALSADGIPLHEDYWFPAEAAYGEFPLFVESEQITNGWLLADPPARWQGGGNRPRVGVETPHPDTLDVTVPPNSRLDDQGNTAPRLLHQVSGDFDLQAEVWISGEGQESTRAEFLVRAPGTRAGTRAGHFAEKPDGGPGRDYWLGGTGLAGASDGQVSLPALNERTPTRWSSVAEGPIHLRFSRRDRVWFTAWSHDGQDWQFNHLAVADLPETLWVGWFFSNTARASSAVSRVSLTNVRLKTAPLETLSPPFWYTWARNGLVVIQDSVVRLSLAGDELGTARALSGQYLMGDFDVQVGFELRSPGVLPDEVRRWTLAAVGPAEDGLAVGCELSDKGLRCGVVHQEQTTYSTRTAMQYGTDVLDTTSGTLRLVREASRISAYFRPGGSETSFQEMTYRNQDKSSFEGPLFLRLEAANRETAKAFAAMEVAFAVEDLTSQAPESYRPMVSAEVLEEMAMAQFEAHVRAMQTHFQKGALQKAHQSAQAALNLNPSHVETRAMLMQLQNMLELVHQVLSHVQTAMPFPEAHSNLLDADELAYVEVFECGEVDWTQGVLRATGRITLSEDTAAKPDVPMTFLVSALEKGLQKILTLAWQLRVDDAKQIGEKIITDPQYRRQVAEGLKNSLQFGKEMEVGNILKVTVILPFYSNLLYVTDEEV